MFIERVNDNFFNLEFQEEIKPTNDDDKLTLSKKLKDIIENMIIRNPYQWIWTQQVEITKIILFFYISL